MPPSSAIFDVLMPDVHNARVQMCGVGCRLYGAVRNRHAELIVRPGFRCSPSGKYYR